MTLLSAVIPPGHPARALGRGKLLAVDEPAPRPAIAVAGASASFPPSGPTRLRLARKTLISARDELFISFAMMAERLDAKCVRWWCVLRVSWLFGVRVYGK